MCRSWYVCWCCWAQSYKQKVSDGSTTRNQVFGYTNLKLKAKKCWENKAFLHFLAKFLAYWMLFQSFAVPLSSSKKYQNSTNVCQKILPYKTIIPWYIYLGNPKIRVSEMPIYPDSSLQKMHFVAAVWNDLIPYLAV